MFDFRTSVKFYLYLLQNICFYSYLISNLLIYAFVLHLICKCNYLIQLCRKVLMYNILEIKLNRYNE